VDIYAPSNRSGAGTIASSYDGLFIGQETHYLETMSCSSFSSSSTATVVPF